MSDAAAAATTTSPQTPSETPLVRSYLDKRHDRSERLFSADGLKRLSEAHVVLLGATATGCETLKNMILPNLGRFTIVDDAKVTSKDVGCNFFVSHDSVGSNIAEECVRNLKELNPFTESHAFDANIAEFVRNAGDGFLYGEPAKQWTDSPDPHQHREASDDPNAPPPSEFMRKKNWRRPPFQATEVIVTSRVPIPVLQELARQLHVRNVPMFYVKANGLLGYMRVCAPDMTVIDTAPGPDDRIFDPRVVKPFPELQDIYEHLNPLNLELDDETYHHLPWPAIAYHALKKWRQDNNADGAPDAVPSTNPERFQIKKKIIPSLAEPRGNRPVSFDEAVTEFYRVWSHENLTDQLKDIFRIAHSKVSMDESAFWAFMAAIKDFYEAHGHLPLNAKCLPDFTTTTPIYMSILAAYEKQAEREAWEVYERAAALLKASGSGSSQVSDHAIHKKIHIQAAMNICSHSHFCQHVPYPSFDDEFGDNLTKPFSFDDSNAAAAAADSSAVMRWQCRTNPGEDVNSTAGWYTAVRCVMAFRAANNGRYPGEVGCTPDQLKADQEAMLNLAATMTGCAREALPANVAKQVQETCRYGGGELGYIASIVGALASQEIIKSIQHLRVTVSAWTLFDGNASKFCQVEQKTNNA